MKPISDPVFPGVAAAFDIDRVLELLRRGLPECAAGLELVGGRTANVQYHPGSRCSVMYKLRFKDRASGRTANQLVSARLLKADEEPVPLPPELDARYQAFRAQDSDPVITSYLYLPEVRMELCPFPVDPELPGLLDAMDPRVMQQALDRMWGERGLEVRGVESRMLGYTARMRASFGYNVSTVGPDAGPPEIRRLVGKINPTHSAAWLFANAWALWRAAGERVRMVRPVGYLTAANLWLQEFIPGTKLSGLAHLDGFVAPVRRAARSIAAVHELSVPAARRRDFRTEARTAQRWARLIAKIRPGLDKRVQDLSRRVVAELEHRMVVKAPVHNDFHLGNVLVEDGRVTLIDFDQMVHGDPLYDVGRFLGALRIAALRVTGDPAGLAEAGDAFFDEYLRRTGEEVSRARLYEAAALLMSAAAPFRLQRKGWRQATVMLVDEVERALELARRGARVSLAGGIGRDSPRLGNGVRWAKDERYMRALLDPAIRDRYGVELTACRVSGDSEARRGEPIRYHLAGRQGGDEWAVSLDGFMVRGNRGSEGACRRLQALWDALDGQPEAPLLPRPVAYLAPIGMQVAEAAPPGDRFSDLVGTPAAAAAAAAVGRCLAALHRARPAISKTGSLDDALAGLRRRADRLAARRPELGARAGALLAAVAPRLPAVEMDLGPVLRDLSPEHLVLLEGRVALAVATDVTLSHPFIDLAEQLARLTLMGIERDLAQAFTEAADRVRDAYLAARGIKDDAVATFEVGALLRLAAIEAGRDPRGIAADRLLDHAEARLAAS